MVLLTRNRRPHTPSSSLGQFAQTWWFELLACFLALVSLFAIVGTTYAFQDLPLPRWPYNLSINTLVSVYIVALKTSILVVVSQGNMMSKLAFVKIFPRLDLCRGKKLTVVSTT